MAANIVTLINKSVKSAQAHRHESDTVQDCLDRFLGAKPGQRQKADRTVVEDLVQQVAPLHLGAHIQKGKYDWADALAILIQEYSKTGQYRLLSPYILEENGLLRALLVAEIDQDGYLVIRRE